MVVTSVRGWPEELDQQNNQPMDLESLAENLVEVIQVDARSMVIQH